jgi:hypothetical protein
LLHAYTLNDGPDTAILHCGVGVMSIFSLLFPKFDRRYPLCCPRNPPCDLVSFIGLLPHDPSHFVSLTTTVKWKLGSRPIIQSASLPRSEPCSATGVRTGHFCLSLHIAMQFGLYLSPASAGDLAYSLWGFLHTKRWWWVSGLRSLILTKWTMGFDHVVGRSQLSRFRDCFGELAPINQKIPYTWGTTVLREQLWGPVN